MPRPRVVRAAWRLRERAPPPRRHHPQRPLSDHTVARTLLDLATRYGRRALLRALAEAEFQHDLRPEDIERTCVAGTGAAPTCAPH